ncbi:unnamed protein product, partial [Sphacelaria rigidula]
MSTASEQHNSTNVDCIRTVESNFRQAVADRPDDVFALSALAQLLADLGRRSEAERLFERVIAAPNKEGKDISTEASSCWDDEALALTMGWYAALVEGQGVDGAGKAGVLYEKALRLSPRNCLCLGNYAVFLHRIVKDFK